MRLRAGDLDVELQSSPIKRRDKELNENLAPLRRYLERQIGRPWDKIYSEIRSNLDARKATGLHILQHVEDYVDLHCVLDGKSGVLACRRGVWAPVWRMYVHPKTGLLRKAPRRHL